MRHINPNGMTRKEKTIQRKKGMYITVFIVRTQDGNWNQRENITESQISLRSFYVFYIKLSLKINERI